MDKKVSGKEAMDAINRIFDRCEELDRTEYKMLPDVLLVEQFIRENSEDWREVPEWMT